MLAHCGRVQQALEQGAEVLALCEASTTLGPKHLSTASLQVKTGLWQLQLGDALQAADLLRKGLGVWEGLLPAGDAELVRAQMALQTANTMF